MYDAKSERILPRFVKEKNLFLYLKKPLSWYLEKKTEKIFSLMRLNKKKKNEKC